MIRRRAAVELRVVENMGDSLLLGTRDAGGCCFDPIAKVTGRGMAAVGRLRTQLTVTVRPAHRSFPRSLRTGIDARPS